MIVVLDTNALMMPVECDVRLFEELERLLGDVEPVVPAPVVAELEKLAAQGNGEAATAASVGRDLLDRCRVWETTAEYADDAVLELATGGDLSAAQTAASGAPGTDGTDETGLTPESKHPVVTNDDPLAARVLDAGVSVIRLRGKNKLAITQP